MINSMLKYLFVQSVLGVLNNALGIESALIDKILTHDHDMSISCQFNNYIGNIEESQNYKTLKEKIGAQKAGKWGCKLLNVSTNIDRQFSCIARDDDTIEEIKKARGRLYGMIMGSSIEIKMWDKIFKSMVRLFLVSISLSDNIDRKNETIKRCYSSLFTENVLTSVTQAICSVTLEPSNYQSFRKKILETFLEEKNMRKQAILRILGLLIDIENVLNNDVAYSTKHAKGIKIIYILRSAENRQTHNLRLPDSNIKYDLEFIEDKMWSKIYLYTDIFNLEIEKNFSKYSIKSLYEAKYISNADIKKLCNACCAFLDPKFGLNNESLRFDFLKRNDLNLVLSDIIFNAFRLIESEYKLNKNNSDGSDTVQFLFRSLNTNYNKNIVTRLVSITNLTDDNSKLHNLTYLVEVLGIYAYFIDIMEQCWIIRKYEMLFEELSSNVLTTSKDKKLVYKILYMSCLSLASRLQEHIEKPDSAILCNFSNQLSITNKVILSVENNAIFARELLRFTSKIGSLTKEQNITNIKLGIGNIIDALELTNDYLRTLSALNSLYFCKIIYYMIDTVSYAIEELPAKEVINFIESCCSVIAELSNNIQPSRMIQNLEISQYTNIRDIFISITAHIVGKYIWETYYMLIYYRYVVLSPQGFDIFPNTIVILDFIMNIFRVTIKNFEFINKSIPIIGKVVLEIEEKSEDHLEVDDQFFLEICTLLQQDNILLEMMGYKSVTGVIEDRQCYICTNEINVSPVKVFNCVCKSSYLTDFHCLIKSGIIACRSTGRVKFVPVCPICKK